MANLAYDTSRDQEELVSRPADTRPVPRITIQAFCDTPEIAGIVETSAPPANGGGM